MPQQSAEAPTASAANALAKGLFEGLLSWDFWGNFISVCWYIVATELQ